MLEFIFQTLGVLLALIGVAKIGHLVWLSFRNVQRVSRLCEYGLYGEDEIPLNGIRRPIRNSRAGS